MTHTEEAALIADAKAATLGSFYERAKQAHSWTSFSPEIRGAQLILNYSSLLDEDLLEIPEESKERYKAKFSALFSDYISALSRCASPMITGPARFNTAKHEKANKAERAKAEFIDEWRERVKRSIKKRETWLFKQEEKAKGIKESDKVREEVERLKAVHAKNLEINKRIREGKKKGEDLTEYLLSIGQPKHIHSFIIACGITTANSLANIKRAEERLAVLLKKEELAASVGSTSEVDFMEGGKIWKDFEADRIKISFNGKPSAELIGRLKKCAFKWAPSAGVWQRQITPNALYCVKREFEIVF